MIAIPFDTFARRLAGLAVGGCLAFGLLALPASAQSSGPTVFAAASMKTALDEVDALYAAETGKTVVASYAASSALAKQIEQGAPADLFVSADIPWMDYLAGKGLIRPDSRVDLLGNELVLVAPASSPEKIEIGPTSPLAAKTGDGKIATGDVGSVPVGKYAKAALEKLGLWKDVEPKIAGVENVRAALGLVARGEAKYGIVYATDAKSEPKVAVVGVFPEDSHPPIVYPVAITEDSTNPDAAAYLAFLKGPKAAKIFEAQGFTVKTR
ncbi:MAG: molybdate ABC transporter substrate-binding protein [Hyphomicrobiales bacterium]|nr:molybdate ABC transporter substrate-binding protein [Hyphomicrobiales bacterium]